MTFRSILSMIPTTLTTLFSILLPTLLPLAPISPITGGSFLILPSCSSLFLLFVSVSLPALKNPILCLEHSNFDSFFGIREGGFFPGKQLMDFCSLVCSYYYYYYYYYH